VRDYLLDTNIWSDWYNPKKNDYILRYLENAPDIKFHISAVTWGELRYGYDVLTQRGKRQLGNIWEFVRGLAPKTIQIDKHVARDYGRIRARLFEKYAPKERRRRGLRPEQLIDPVTSLQLGIQENDLWIASQAITRDLVLVTNDIKSMRPLREVAGNDLIVETWAGETA